MRFVLRALSGLVILAICIALLGGGIWRLNQARDTASSGKSRPATERSYSVKVGNFEAGSVTPEIHLYADVLARRTLELRAPASGALAELASNFRDGESIDEGEVLARVDPADATSRVAQANVGLSEAQTNVAEARAAVELVQSEIKSAERQLELRQQDLDRQTQLFKKGIVARVAVDNAELAVANADQALSARRQQLLGAQMKIDTAELAVRRANITVSDSDTDLSETILRAPFSGRLSEVSATAGRRVTANEKLGLLIDPLDLEVRFTVREEIYGRLVDDTGKLKPLPVRVSLNLGDRDVTHTGTLDRDAPVVDTERGGRAVFARLAPVTGTLLRPGDFVELSMTEPALENVFTIPSTAISEDGHLFVIDEDKRLEEIKLKVLRRYADKVVVANAPIGRSYVVTRKPQLGNGTQVAISNDKAAPSGDGAGDGMIVLAPERKARLLAAIENNKRMPAEVQTRILEKLAKERVPAAMVERIESRMRKRQSGG